jgi:hypothetical protein
MDKIDALSDALSKAGVNGDYDAAIFLQMFAAWAAGQRQLATHDHNMIQRLRITIARIPESSVPP